jgi:hypothetical protein
MFPRKKFFEIKVAKLTETAPQKTAKSKVFAALSTTYDKNFRNFTDNFT